MKKDFTTVFLDFARLKALRYVRKLQNCTFDGYLYCFARIFNAFSRLGLFCYLEITWSPDYTEKCYHVNISFAKGVGSGSIVASAVIYDDGNPSNHVELLTKEINGLCKRINEWYFDPKTSPLL